MRGSTCSPLNLYNLPVREGMSFIHWPRSSSSMALMVEDSMEPGCVGVLHSISPEFARSSAVSWPSRVETINRFLLVLGC